MPVVRTRGGYDLWFETKGEESSPSVLLLHGFTGTHHGWDALVERLSKTHRVIAPDLPGHGASGASADPRDLSLEATSTGLVRVLDELRVRRTALVGYSLGGRIALDFAVAHQDRLCCLVLESASPGIADAAEREKRAQDDDALAEGIEKKGVGWFVDHWENLPLFATQKELPPQVFQRVRRERLSQTQRGLSMSLRGASTGRMTPLWDSLQGLRVPTLLVAGGRDERYTEAGRAMARRIPGSTLKVIEGAGHCAHLERPLLFEEAVAPFLEAHAGGGRD